MFAKFIKKNDTSYVYILSIQFIGIVINFIELLSSISLNLFFKILIYLLSVIIPAIIIIFEKKKNTSFPEIFNIWLANIAFKGGNTEKAKEYLFKLINKYPTSYEGHKALAKIYEKEGNYSVAIDEYIRVTEINNNNMNINYNIARLLNIENRPDEAITILQDILKKKPEYYDATNLLGEILYNSERYKEAINVYTNALRYNPGNYDLYYNLGMAFTMVNDFQKAKEFYKKAAEINSLLYNAKLSLGQIALIAGELEEAEKYFNESLKGEESESGSYYYLAQVAILKGDKEKAVNYMNIAIDLEPKIYLKVQKETVFTPIMNEIRKPKQIEKKENKNRNKRRKLSLKEIKAINHLSKTCSLISNLNNDDIKIMRNLMQQQKQVKEQQREK